MSHSNGEVRLYLMQSAPTKKKDNEFVSPAILETPKTYQGNLYSNLEGRVFRHARRVLSND